MWQPYTIDNLRGALAKAELSGLTNASRSANVSQEDILIDAVADARRIVLSYVRVRYTPGARGTLPDECFIAANAIARDKIFTRLPELSDLNGETRKAQLREAYRFLENISKGVAHIEEATDTGDEQGGGTGPLISDPDNKCTIDF